MILCYTHLISIPQIMREASAAADGNGCRNPKTNIRHNSGNSHKTEREQLEESEGLRAL